MKRILSLITASGLIFSVAPIQVSAGAEISTESHSHTQKAPLDLRDIPISDDTITSVQNIAMDSLNKYYNPDPSRASDTDNGVISSYRIPDNLHGTVYNLDLKDGVFSYLYLKSVLATPKSIITAFIPGASSWQALRSLKDSFCCEIYDAAALIHAKPGSATLPIEQRMLAICAVIEQKKLNSNHKLATRKEKNDFMYLCRFVNRWNLYSLLNAESEKLRAERKDVTKFGFLVTEVTNSIISTPYQSPDEDIVGPSTFYVKTIPLP